jgi:menaquinone-dependent protoporphyrinogen IX oxidase
MAINKAVDICTFNGDVNEEKLWYYSSMLIRLAQKLQAGNLVPERSNEPSEEQPY